MCSTNLALESTDDSCMVEHVNFSDAADGIYLLLFPRMSSFFAEGLGGGVYLLMTIHKCYNP